LKPKTAVREGTRIRCPKCKGAFTAEAEPKPPDVAPIHEPILTETQEPMPEPAEPAPEEMLDVVLEEIVESPSRPAPRPPRPDSAAGPRRRSDNEYEAERKSRFLRPKRGVPLWVWFLSGGVGFVLLASCCGVGGTLAWRNFGTTISVDNYNKIQGRMTPAQVEKIMGQPTSSGPTSGFGSEVWRNGDSFITVMFVNGQAFGKACRLPQGAGTVERQDLLGP
jgi:hypothetical protein